MVRITVAYQKWQRLAEIEEKLLKQRSKLHWLKVDDRNNKAYYRAIKARESRNGIKEIKNAQGEVLNDQEDIKIEAVRFFESFLGFKPEGYCGVSEAYLRNLMGFVCSEEDGNQLVKEVTGEEIKSVLFSMPKDKAPGPDGYTVEFFKSSWAVIGDDLVAAVKSFFQKNFIPKGVNATILFLIPKKKDAMEMKDYRPISCCNVVYKIVSKIIANRLKEILPQFISNTQSAFVKERLLMENVLMASEIVKDYHTDDMSPRSAMKIDISKAFDYVQWPFLITTLRALNLPQQFVRWIELCVTTASFSVQVNGELSGLFKSERGLRQGCALSPYLFVICMNVLSCMLNSAATKKYFGYHPSCEKLKLTHLSFADDLLVFTDGERKSIEGVIAIFKIFAGFSGLNISVEKSTLFMAGVSVEIRATILARFPFAVGALPVRYLGLPLLTKQMRANDYLPLIERVKQKIESWKYKHLSFAGRLQLINAVIHSLVNFWMSAYRLPSACIREINQLCSAFLWSGPELNAHKAKVAWLDVCKPKQEGGLGVRSLIEVNKVSCLKLIWRLMTGESLWAKWVDQQLIKRRNFWTVKETTSLGSWMWKKLLKYRSMAAGFLKKKVNNGISTLFWYDNWSEMGRLIEVVGEHGRSGFGIKDNATVAEVVGSRRLRRHRIARFNEVENQILKLRLEGLGSEKDVVLWKGTHDEYKSRFVTKEVLMALRTEQPTLSWYKAIWFSGATPRYSFIAWLAILNRLATGDRMAKWNGNSCTECVFCKYPEESRAHLFFVCRFSREIWKKLVGNIMGTKFTVEWNGILHHITEKTVDSFLLRYTFQSLVYMLWRERNVRRHGGLSLPESVLTQLVDKGVRNRLSILKKEGRHKFDSLMQRWFETR